MASSSRRVAWRRRRRSSLALVARWSASSHFVVGRGVVCTVAWLVVVGSWSVASSWRRVLASRW
ncbi:hypothetical protein ACXZ9C_11870 [Streptococcus agalactiae]